MKRSFILLILLLAPTISHSFNEEKSDKSVVTLSYPKNENWSLSKTFLQKLVDIFNVDTFVESGTYAGGTTHNASLFFNQVYTVELSTEFYKKAINRFKDDTNVHVYHGDSSNVFIDILPSISGKILFWLDGHYSEGTTAKGEKNTPVVEELEAIKKCGITDSVILIDDIRCFQEYENTPENQSLMGYPSVKKLKQLILDINKDYKFVIFGDIAIAYLASENVDFSPVVQACTKSRLYENGDEIFQEILEAEKIIGCAQKEEQETLKKLYLSYRPSSTRHGLGKHLYLWHGLILAQKKYYSAAKAAFFRAIELGISENHIQQHLSKI